MVLVSGPTRRCRSLSGQIIVSSVSNHAGTDGDQRDADINMTTFDPVSGSATTVAIANIPTGGNGDDHNAVVVAATRWAHLSSIPAITTAMEWMQSTRDDYPDTFYRISRFPHNATEWGEEHEFRWPSNDPVGLGHNAVTYSNLHYLSAEGGDKGACIT